MWIRLLPIARNAIEIVWSSCQKLVFEWRKDERVVSVIGGGARRIGFHI